MESTLREPAVAGTFYPDQAADLDRQVRELMPVAEQRHPLLACIAPHAGYIYSGGVVGRLFGHLDVPRRVVVLGPNHTGIGAMVAVAPHRGWLTPLGECQTDTHIAAAIADRVPGAMLDADAHWREHSLEVQLPFLLARQAELIFSAVCLGHLTLDQCLDFGRILATLIEETGEPVGIVASSDMSHYLADDEARTLDRRAIDAALTLDPAALYETVHSEGITMCGVVPATVALEAARRLGATDAHLLAYATSGEVNNDRSAVVGYAGMCIHQ